MAFTIHGVYMPASTFFTYFMFSLHIGLPSQILLPLIYTGGNRLWLGKLPKEKPLEVLGFKPNFL